MKTLDRETTKTIDALIRKADMGGLTGYAGTWWTLDNAGDVLFKGAAAEDVERIPREVFLTDINHDFDDPLGKITEAKEDDIGLWVAAKYSDVESVKDTRTLINDRVIQWLSVTFATIEAEYITPDELVQIWYQVGYQPNDDDLRRLKTVDIIRLIKKIKVREVTPATMPINHRAVILTSKSIAPPRSIKALARRAMQACDTMKSQDRLQAVVDVLTSVVDHARMKLDNEVPSVEAVAETMDTAEVEAHAALELAIALG